MTIQIGERIIYKGEKRTMQSEPLFSYLRKNKHHKFNGNCTALIRGYWGHWEIKGNKLYLIDLKSFSQRKKDMNLETLFPGKKKVFAEWFSGEIKIIDGKLIKHVNVGYESIFEKYIILDVKKGVVKKETIMS